MRKGDLNCSSKFVIYRLVCKTCSKQYVGSTITPFRSRFNNYKSHFRAFCERKSKGTLNQGRVVPQVGLFKHFTQDGHNGMADWDFQLIDKSDNETQLRERELFWQYKLNTFLPIGLNERSVPA